MINIRKAIRDPSSVFGNPFDVVRSQSITRKQKIEILKQWEYDARELSVAEEENMVGGNHANLLEQVLLALHQLGVDSDTEHGSSTKQGG